MKLWKIDVLFSWYFCIYPICIIPMLYAIQKILLSLTVTNHSIHIGICFTEKKNISYTMRLKVYYTKVHSTRDILWILDSKIGSNTLGNLYSSSRSRSSEVPKHIHIEPPGYHVDLDQVKILDRKTRYCVKEVIYIRINKPSLNKDRCRCKLPRVFNPILKSSVHKGHCLLIWVTSLQAKVEGSTKKVEVCEIFCGDHEFKSMLNFTKQDILHYITLRSYSKCSWNKCV